MELAKKELARLGAFVRTGELKHSRYYLNIDLESEEAFQE